MPIFFYFRLVPLPFGYHTICFSTSTVHANAAAMKHHVVKEIYEKTFHIFRLILGLMAALSLQIFVQMATEKKQVL